MDYKSTLMWKEISETPNVFNAIASNNIATMKEVVAAIKNSNATNFVCAARGTSDHALTFFKYLCEQYTPYTVSLAAPSVVTQYNGKISYKNSVVIGCSQSGKAADCIEVLKRANADGAVTIAITNDQTSPMAECAKYHLFCSAGLEKSVAATKTFSAQLYICAWLVALLSEDKQMNNLMHDLSKTAEGWLTRCDLLTEAFVPELKDMKSGFILSRGTTFAIALEATLKLQETCYIQMKGYAGSDFYHGPMAMVNERTPVIVYCAKHADEKIASVVFEDQVKCVEKMISLNAPVFVVTTDEAIQNQFASKAAVALIPDVNDDRVAMFAFAIFAQMLACKISCAIGNNPDSPRALNKVTITK